MHMDLYRLSVCQSVCSSACIISESSEWISMKFGICDITLKFVLLAFAFYRVDITLISLRRARVEAGHCANELVHSVCLEFC
jgi:hypothetical protein